MTDEYAEPVPSELEEAVGGVGGSSRSLDESKSTDVGAGSLIPAGRDPNSSRGFVNAAAAAPELRNAAEELISAAGASGKRPVAGPAFAMGSADRAATLRELSSKVPSELIYEAIAKAADTGADWKSTLSHAVRSRFTDWDGSLKDGFDAVVAGAGRPKDWVDPQFLDLLTKLAGSPQRPDVIAASRLVGSGAIKEAVSGATNADEFRELFTQRIGTVITNGTGVVPKQFAGVVQVLGEDPDGGGFKYHVAPELLKLNYVQSGGRLGGSDDALRAEIESMVQLGQAEGLAAIRNVVEQSTVAGPVRPKGFTGLRNRGNGKLAVGTGTFDNPSRVPVLMDFKNDVGEFFTIGADGAPIPLTPVTGSNTMYRDPAGNWFSALDAL